MNDSQFIPSLTELTSIVVFNEVNYCILRVVFVIKINSSFSINEVHSICQYERIKL